MAMQTNEVKERLKEYIREVLKIPVSRFEREMGFANGYVAQFGGKFGSGKLEQILDKHKDLNPEWLLTGVGERTLSTATVNQHVGMLNSDVTQVNNSIVLPKESDGKKPEKVDVHEKIIVEHDHPGKESANDSKDEFCGVTIEGLKLMLLQSREEVATLKSNLAMVMQQLSTAQQQLSTSQQAVASLSEALATKKKR